MNAARRFSLLFFIPIALAVGTSSCHGHKHDTSSSNKVTQGKPTQGEKSSGLTPAEKSLQEKYAGLVGVPASKISNLKLYGFIDQWYGTPYRYGGKTRDGVDCSGFASALYRDVYKLTIAGSAASISTGTETVEQKNLKEGDLVFFTISGGKISHVGVYLQNNKFVHASTHKGVMISDLGEAYYTKYFTRGGRLKNS